MKGGAAILPCREEGRSSPYIIDRRSVNTKGRSIKQCLSGRSSSLQRVSTLGEALPAPPGHLIPISTQQEEGVTRSRGSHEEQREQRTADYVMQPSSSIIPVYSANIKA